jgi:hypothetical protein
MWISLSVREALLILATIPAELLLKLLWVKVIESLTLEVSQCHSSPLSAK